MDKNELNIYTKQFLALILVYIACMLPIIYTHPSFASMECNSYYTCKVEINYPLNIKQSENLYVNQNAKIRFWHGDGSHSGFVNVYDNEDFQKLTINADPFGTDNFYTCSNGESHQMHEKMNQDIERFNSYIKNPEQKFYISKEYDNKRFKLLAGLITILFLCLAFTKRPITNIFNFIEMIFNKRY